MSDRRAFSIPFAVWVVSRLGLLAVSAGALSINGVLERPGGSNALHGVMALDALCRWDCSFVEEIATIGYSRAAMTNFFPLLPLLVRGLFVVGVPIHLGLVIIPNLAALLGYVGVFRAMRHVVSVEAATYGLVLFVAFPFSFFHGAGYPESLMFCATAWTLAFALEGKSWAAGLALGVGTLTRHLAFLAWPALVVALVMELGVVGTLKSRRLFSLAIPPLVFSGWMAWQWWAFADPLAFLHARAAWAGDAWWGVTALFTQPDLQPQLKFYAVFALLPTLAAAWLAQRKTAPFATYAVVYLGLSWAIGIAGLGRYTASFWPAFLPLGVLVEKRPWLLGPLVMAFAGAQGVFFTVFAHQFPIL